MDLLVATGAEIRGDLPPVRFAGAEFLLPETVVHMVDVRSPDRLGIVVNLLAFYCGDVLLQI